MTPNKHSYVPFTTYITKKGHYNHNKVTPLSFHPPNLHCLTVLWTEELALWQSEGFQGIDDQMN